MPYQEALTVIAPIMPGEVEAVRRVLGTIPDHVDAWDVIPFDKLPRLHFARLVVFDEAADLDGQTIGAQLALMTNVDAPLDAHLPHHPVDDRRQVLQEVGRLGHEVAQARADGPQQRPLVVEPGHEDRGHRDAEGQELGVEVQAVGPAR